MRIRRLLTRPRKSHRLLTGGRLLFLLASGLWWGGVALAQDQTATSTLAEGVAIIEQPLGLPATDIRLIVANIIRVALGLLGAVILGYFLYGGYLWMTAGGNEERIGTAKQVIKNAVIGLAIILAAYSIVLFVMRLLGVGAGELGGPGMGAPATQNFRGSGALGSIIKDHYPGRNEVNVARNTKIVITFRRAVKLDSFVEDTNNSKVFGDCVNIGPNLKWDRDCDALRLGLNRIAVAATKDGKLIKGAAVLGQREGGKVFTIVIRPYNYLGSAEALVPYTVRAGKDIQLDDQPNNNPSIFSGAAAGNDFYEWQFTTATTLDLTPPYVQNTYPGAGVTTVKNTVIQIDFNEPMDPTGLQGEFKSGNGYYVLEGNNIFLQSVSSTLPLGSFTLANGYRTLEFTPTIECGTNACGGKVFCLPVCDREGADCDRDPYLMLLGAAETFTNASFEAIPFSGAADLASNALDGNRNLKVDRVDRTRPPFPDQQRPDNYFWNFVVKDELDLTAPFLAQVAPGLDAQFVAPTTPWQMQWNKRMRIAPFYDLAIEEKPTPAERGDNIPLCQVPRVNWLPDDTTLVDMNHCPFLDGRRQYYYPVITSAVEDAHFNCFYPGVGPGGVLEVQKRRSVSSVCVGSGPNCCPVATSTPHSAFCCNGGVLGGVIEPGKCVTELKSVSP